MRNRSRTIKSFFYLFFATLVHLATAAFRALSARCSAVNFFARAFPPLRPPSRPSATAAAFLFLVAISNKSHKTAAIESLN
jgi:hypothetical protein